MLIHFGDDAPMYSDVVVIIYPSRNSNWCYNQMITDGQYVWDLLTQVASKWLNIIRSKNGWLVVSHFHPIPKKYVIPLIYHSKSLQTPNKAFQGTKKRLMAPHLCGRVILWAPGWGISFQKHLVPSAPSGNLTIENNIVGECRFLMSQSAPTT